MGENVAEPELVRRIMELEAQLAEAHARLAADQGFVSRLLNDLSAGIAYFDRDLRYQLVNETYARITVGRPQAFYLGRYIGDVLPDTAGDTAALLRRILETGEPWRQSAWPVLLERDGRTVETFWEFEAFPTRDAAGATTGVVVWSTESTERVRLERELATNLAASEAQARALAQEKAFAESLIRNVPNGIAFLDRDLVYQVVNPAYGAFLGLAPEAIVGKQIFDVLRGGEGQLEPLLARVLATGETYRAQEFPFTYRAPDGGSRQTFWDFGYFPAVLGDGAGTRGVLVVADEVSDRVLGDREKERLHHERIEALEQADQLKDQFLSILSHELRTPINAIMGFGSILEDEVAGPMTAAQRSYAHKILEGADTLLALIDDLLVISRVQAGKFSVNPRTADFKRIVARALETMQPIAARKAIHMVAELPADLPPLVADAQRIGQVVTNLVGNALKFSPDGGQVTVRARIVEGFLRAEVVDDGPGIAQADQGRLFKRFGQLDTSATRNAKGTGLGLSIVKAIAEAHGGAVGVESAPGAGSTFWFELPLVPPPGLRTGPAAP